MESMAQKEAKTDSHPASPPSGKVRADEVDMREATRSGNFEGARDTWRDLDVVVVMVVWVLMPSALSLPSCFSCSSLLLLLLLLCCASRLMRTSSSSSLWESSFSKSPSAEASDRKPPVSLEEKVSRHGSCLKELSSAWEARKAIAAAEQKWEGRGRAKADQA